MTPSPSTLSPSKIERLRCETPAVLGRVHLDSAGASLMPQFVANVLLDHHSLELDVGGYVAQERAAERIDASYGAVARLLGAQSAEIALLASATEAWDRAFYSLPLQPGDRVVTAHNEYCSNFVAYLHRVRRDGIEIEVLQSDARGDIDLGDLEKRLSPPPALVSLSHVPSSSGQINDVAAVGVRTRAAGVPFLLDACQSVGQLPVDVGAIGCDMLTGTARKFLRGPRGVGFLFVRSDFLDRLDPVMLTNSSATWTGPDSYDLRSDARLFEAWERNVAGQLALGAAAEYLMAVGVQAASLRARTLANRLRAGLAALAGVTLTDPGADLSAIVTFTHDRLVPNAIKEALEAQGIAVQVASQAHTLLDLRQRGIAAAVRMSPHYFNTEDEIDRTLDSLAGLR